MHQVTPALEKPRVEKFPPRGQEEPEFESSFMPLLKAWQGPE